MSGPREGRVKRVDNDKGTNTSLGPLFFLTRGRRKGRYSMGPKEILTWTLVVLSACGWTWLIVVVVKPLCTKLIRWDLRRAGRRRQTEQDKIDMRRFTLLHQAMEMKGAEDIEDERDYGWHPDWRKGKKGGGD